MANKKISDLTALTTPVSGDLFELVDISDTTDAVTGTNKKVTLANLEAGFSFITDSSVDTLTNKTFDQDGTGNSITNLADASIKAAAAIDATKIADGTVTSTEFQYINTLSSNAQTQLTAKLENISEDTTPQLGGDLDYNSNGMKLISQTVGGSNGDAVYLSGSNTWSQADSSAEATCSNQLGIRISATEVLTHGVYTTSGLTAGSIYYVSETAGAITTTAPSTSASIVRPIGYALTTTELYIDPDKSWVENL